MDYFSYFIKCMIRNISRLLCKPKILLLIVVIVCVFFFLQTTSRAEFTQDDSYMMGTINTNLNYICRLIETVSKQISETSAGEQAELKNIYDRLYDLNNKVTLLQSALQTDLSKIDYDINTINTNVNYVCRLLESLNKELETVDYDIGTVNTNLNHLARVLENVYNQINDILTILVNSQEELKNLQQENNNLQQEQNKLQEEQNKLQQEQNDFLKKEPGDSDVAVGDFSSVDSNDITSSGLSSVFTSIYNSISSWKSKDIELPIPYTNTSIKIPANYTENMLKTSGGTWLITFISTIYYFVVGRFMIYSITKIINDIKSGKILDTESSSNITTDML